MNEAEYQESQGNQDFEFFCESHEYGWNTSEDGTNAGCLFCLEEERFLNH